MKMYHYTECGLNNVYLLNGFKITKRRNGEQEIHIQNIQGLHKKIGMSLIEKSGLLSGAEIKFIRHTIDFSQKTLALYLGVDYQSVLGWEKDKRTISKTADHFLKTIFFSYLNENSSVRDLIKEIANQSIESKNNKIKNTFKVLKQEWCLDKAA